jgi:hypothetical protein
MQTLGSFWLKTYTSSSWNPVCSPCQPPNALELRSTDEAGGRNNRLDQPAKAEADERRFAVLRQHVKHVIYIMKQKRPYD